ncbi:MAG: sterol desaturase family protein [Sandaracinaceae bacterium]|nr:sterol desaturase family protein [Sandaracinaceae bacterium]
MRLFEFTEEVHQLADGKIKLPKGKDRPIRIQVYKNTFLEKWFAQAHPITPGIWFGWMVVYGLYVAVTAHPAWIGLLAFAGGVMITTLIEYFLHRFAFHFEPKSESGRLNHFILHGYHHEFPNDPMRLVLPPIGIWPVAVGVSVLYYFVFGPYFWVVLGGTALGYIAYDWLHYYTHHFNPKGGPGKWLKRYHMLHHFDSPHHRFGITSPLWDLVFGTYMPLEQSWRKQQREEREAKVAEAP